MCLYKTPLYSIGKDNGMHKLGYVSINGYFYTSKRAETLYKEHPLCGSLSDVASCTKCDAMSKIMASHN